MRITCQAQQTLHCSGSSAFDFAIDPLRFPPAFSGYGPIPAIHSITLDGPLAVGVIRHITNSDGSVLTEQVTVLERPVQHSYMLAGFRAPFSWLVKQGAADWRIDANESGTLVRWSYAFELTSVLVYPLAMIVLRFFMMNAMRRCLANMARMLDTTPATNPQSA